MLSDIQQTLKDNAEADFAEKNEDCCSGRKTHIWCAHAGVE